MKTMIKYIKNLVLLFCLLFVFSCSNTATSNLESEKVKDTEDQKQLSDLGSATVKMFIPDYYGLAEKNIGRAIAPQTSSARLCYLVNGNWVGIKTVSLSQATKTAVENAPDGFTGSVYTVSFSGVPVGVYAAGNLKLEFLDASSLCITSGANSTSVTITKGGSASTTFYTVPEASGANNGNLEAGQMKFSRAALVKDVEYTLKLTSSGDYPDLVLFGSDGKIANYFAIDNESSASNIKIKVNNTDVYYLGLWADDGNAIARYELNFDFGKGTQLNGVLSGENLHWTKENGPYC